MSEEDRGSYLNFEGDCEEESPKVVSNRLSQEMMPPPSSTGNILGLDDVLIRRKKMIKYAYINMFDGCFL